MNFDDRYREYIKKMVVDSNDEKFEDLFNNIDWNTVFEEYRYYIIDDIECILFYYGNSNDSYDISEEERNKLYDKLMRLISNFEFNDDDKLYTKLKCAKDKSYYIYSSSDSIRNILMNKVIRRNIINGLSEDEFNLFSKLINDNSFNSSSRLNKLLKDEESIEDLVSSYSNLIDELTTLYFNDRINCGGYALELDCCVFPFASKDLSACVSTILNNTDFVRLLGNSKLEDDEYLVFYRVSDNGHHFIRVNDDGSVVEKDAREAPRVFNDWGNLEGLPEATFAVKKDHDMFVNPFYNCEVGLNFEDTISNAVSNSNDSFKYHCKEYRLVKKSDDEYSILDSNNKKVAFCISNGEDTLTQIIFGKEKEVENLSSNVKCNIKNGKLVNLNEFKSIDKVIEIE